MTANVVDTPASSASTYTYAPTAAMAPCAKFRTPGAPVDEHDALGRERVDPAEAEAEQRELGELGQCRFPLVPRRATGRKHDILRIEGAASTG